MEKQFIRSERAHFMCPNMHFGILAEIKARADRKKIEDSLDLMAEAHPFLKCLIKYENDHKNLFYDVQQTSMVRVAQKNKIEDIWEDYRKIGETEWNVFEHGLLQVLIYPRDEEMSILFVAHHLLGDGRCLLALVEEFVNHYTKGSKPIYAEERLICSLNDLPEKSNLTGISKYLVRNINEKWRKEKKAVTYKEYQAFSDQFVKDNLVSHLIKEVDSKRLKEMKKQCKGHGITINDLLLAKMYTCLNCKKIIIAADVRNKINCYNEGACGNYASAMGITCRIRKNNIFGTAKRVHKQVEAQMTNNRKLMLILSCYLNMDQTLIDAAAISTLGGFDSKAAKFVGAAMFGFQKRDGISITNLGRIKNPNMIKAAFIPPASPATIQTIGVLTVNARMQLCSSYYEHVISEKEVRKQLNEIS